MQSSSPFDLIINPQWAKLHEFKHMLAPDISARWPIWQLTKRLDSWNQQNNITYRKSCTDLILNSLVTNIYNLIRFQKKKKDIIIRIVMKITKRIVVSRGLWSRTWDRNPCVEGSAHLGSRKSSMVVTYIVKDGCLKFMKLQGAFCNLQKRNSKYVFYLGLNKWDKEDRRPLKVYTLRVAQR